MTIYALSQLERPNLPEPKPSKSLQTYQNQEKAIAIYSFNYVHEIDKACIISIIITLYLGAL